MGKSYENPELLEKLYWEDKMSQREIGEKLGCSARTVGRKLKKYNIDTTDSGGTGTPRASYINDPRGYVKAWCNDDNKGIYIHQLVAIFNGADPYKMFDGNLECHHKNKIKWDNRPENIEAETRHEHQAKHIIGGNWTGI